MHVRTVSIDRYRQRIARIAADGIHTAALSDELVDALDAAIGFDGVCSGTVDPATLIPTDIGLLGHPDGGMTVSEAFSISLSAPVHARTCALARAPRPVEILSQTYDGDVERSPLYRHVLAPQGFEHALRAMLVCDGACWGFFSLLRRSGQPDFTQRDADIAEAIAPELARALRRAILSEGDATALSLEDPGVIVLDETLAVIASNPAAEHWLGQLDVTHGNLPPFLHAVATIALGGRDGSPAPAPPRLRVRSRAGDWLHVHATALDGERGRTVAIVIEPARREQLTPVIAHAYGLTAREREVAQLVADGASTAEIAELLFIAPYTVKDHLKAVFDKVGVRNRRDLARALAANQRPSRSHRRSPSASRHP